LGKGISWTDLMMMDGKGLYIYILVIARSLPALEVLCIELRRRK
jgi:hypothetical protein